MDGFPSRVDGFPSSVSCVDGFPSRVDGFPDIWKITVCHCWLNIVTSLFGPIGFHSGFKTQIFQLGPFLDPPTLKVQYFFLVQPTVKTKSVLKSSCT